MRRLQKIRRTVAVLSAATAFLLLGAFTGGSPAAATDPRDAPPGYAGPVATCPGSVLRGYYLSDTSGNTLGSILQVWYSSANGGTYCAKTIDNLSGSHHMEVIVKRERWTTSWYDSGTYTTYAGGIVVYGATAAGECVDFYGRVVVNGVKYSAYPRIC
jgi:hypothetical protein